MDTDSLYLALAEEILYNCIQPNAKIIWEKIRESDCRHFFKGDANSNFFSRKCCSIHKKHMISGSRNF